MRAFTKKAAIAAAIAMMASAATFAQRYSGDVQLQLGWQGATAITEARGTFQLNGTYLGVSNWNLWNVNDLFSVGFFDKFDLGLGQTASEKQLRVGATFVIGGAVGFRLNDIVKFQVGAGFPLGIDYLQGDGNDKDFGGILGFELDAQAKFLPRSIVSPLVGFQYVARGIALTVHTYSLYAGASLNFGMR